MNEPDEIIHTRHLGRTEAEVFDLRLRAAEMREREDRFVRLLAERSDLSAVGTPAGRGDAALLERLQREIDLLAAFHRAVLRSRGWRLLQAIRRIFGRAW
ncbi:MAG TPA: hypothetical protein VF756_18085 [Thermoanaerobaculia bacterium]